MSTPMPAHVSMSIAWPQRKYSLATDDSSTIGETIRQYCVAGMYFSTIPVIATQSQPLAPENIIATHSFAEMFAQLSPAGEVSCGVIGHSAGILALIDGGGTPAGGNQ